MEKFDLFILYVMTKIVVYLKYDNAAIILVVYMSIPPHHYFSNNILFDFPSSGFNFFVLSSWPGSDFGNIKRGIICKMRWLGTTWYNIIVMHITTVIGGKAR